jgi:hypothetical protein
MVVLNAVDKGAWWLDECEYAVQVHAFSML